MGAILVCFGDYKPELDDIRRRERTPSVASLIDHFQRKWSCGRLDDEIEDPINSWDAFLLPSDRTRASSGSRMLSSFYCRLLEENDNCAFYFDSRGTHLQGAYLDQVEWLDDYFMPVGHRRTLSIVSASSPFKSLERFSSSEDCFSSTSTMVSELDNWASLEPLCASGDDERSLRPLLRLGRCLSLGSVHSGHKMHRTFTSMYTQEDLKSAHYYPTGKVVFRE